MAYTQTSQDGYIGLFKTKTTVATSLTLGETITTSVLEVAGESEFQNMTDAQVDVTRYDIISGACKGVEVSHRRAFTFAKALIAVNSGLTFTNEDYIQFSNGFSSGTYFQGLKFMFKSSLTSEGDIYEIPTSYTNDILNCNILIANDGSDSEINTVKTFYHFILCLNAIGGQGGGQIKEGFLQAFNVSGSYGAYSRQFVLEPDYNAYYEKASYDMTQTYTNLNAISFGESIAVTTYFANSGVLTIGSLLTNQPAVTSVFDGGSPAGEWSTGRIFEGVVHTVGNSQTRSVTYTGLATSKVGAGYYYNFQIKFLNNITGVGYGIYTSGGPNAGNTVAVVTKPQNFNGVADMTEYVEVTRLQVSGSTITGGTTTQNLQGDESHDTTYASLAAALPGYDAYTETGGFSISWDNMKVTVPSNGTYYLPSVGVAEAQATTTLTALQRLSLTHYGIFIYKAIDAANVSNEGDNYPLPKYDWPMPYSSTLSKNTSGIETNGRWYFYDEVPASQTSAIITGLADNQLYAIWVGFGTDYTKVTSDVPLRTYGIIGKARVKTSL